MVDIQVSWDASVASAPAGFRQGVTAAVDLLEARISTPVTVNLHVGYGEVGGYPVGGEVGESLTYLRAYAYGTAVGALTSHATSATDASAVASLPARDPAGNTVYLTTAQAKALGLMSGSNGGTDGDVGFSSTLPFTWTDGSGVASGTYDFEATALHEITEVMGRQLMVGSPGYSLYDFLHYSSAGVHDFAAAKPGYFSVNGGKTSLAAFNTVAGGDAGDWASSVRNDAFDAFSSPGVVNRLSPADLTAMDAIGWTLGGSPPGTVASARNPQFLDYGSIPGTAPGAAASSSPFEAGASAGLAGAAASLAGEFRPPGGVGDPAFDAAAGAGRWMGGIAAAADPGVPGLLPSQHGTHPFVIS